MAGRVIECLCLILHCLQVFPNQRFAIGAFQVLMPEVL